MGKTDPWFDALYRNNATRMIKIAYHLLNDRAVAEEVVQDTFVILLTKRSEVELYEHPEAFLMNVLRKRIGNELQRASRRLEEPIGETHEATLAAPSYKERLEDILPDWLTPQERQILIWRVEYGLSFQEIAKRLGDAKMDWDSLEDFGVLPVQAVTVNGPALFPRIDMEKELAALEELSKPVSDIEIEPFATENVDFDTFCKSDFRAVKVKDCQNVKKSDKLLQFTLDDGTGTDRQILSGIAKYYKPEELIGKTLVAIVNLPPRKMMGK